MPLNAKKSVKILTPPLPHRQVRRPAILGVAVTTGEISLPFECFIFEFCEMIGDGVKALRHKSPIADEGHWRGVTAISPRKTEGSSLTRPEPSCSQQAYGRIGSGFSAGPAQNLTGGKCSLFCSRSFLKLSGDPLPNFINIYHCLASPTLACSNPCVVICLLLDNEPSRRTIR